eukprot:CAMPEP_0176459954 /NCGR_PEP_ID=MMETSP0127-20121128/33639_1 /TAXON_ID=938130 /ORGANISM="Platyophrya macrostoma, Strain WH" /LENGTH=51 /DNA_ID=CAMNT_0017851099 /DNA_START=37 /DNA_END=189 /DNA_ORIENTATION=+
MVASTAKAALGANDSIEAARMRLARQWRISPAHVFLMNGQRTLARALIAAK